MSMQALNELVARSIIDPSVVTAFQGGSIEPILSELGFSSEMRQRLGAIKSGNFAEFSVAAYRMVKSAEAVQPRIQLPSPLEGLIVDPRAGSDEQVA